jgi:ABC-type polysaccharide/polyol phosphate export permease
MFSYFLRREITDRYLGNVMGLAWVFIQPLITLVIYSYVFENIFKARIPEAAHLGFAVYLAIGFWPWTAFAESLLRSITALVEKKDLIGKVKIDLRLPVAATVTATFLLHMIGYAVVLLALALWGKPLYFEMLPAIIPAIGVLYLLALAFGFLLSALQVYLKDTLQIMNSLLMLWFFSTPVIYSESLLPESVRQWLWLNPVYPPINFIHQALLFGENLPWLPLLGTAVFAAALLWLSVRVFERLSARFEDFI